MEKAGGRECGESLVEDRRSCRSNEMEGRSESDCGRDEVHPAALGDEERTGLELDDDDDISRALDKPRPLKKLLAVKKESYRSLGKPKGYLSQLKKEQMMYKNYFLRGNDLEKAMYKVYANKLTRVKNLSKKIFYRWAITDKNITLKNYGSLLTQSYF